MEEALQLPISANRLFFYPTQGQRDRHKHKRMEYLYPNAPLEGNLLISAPWKSWQVAIAKMFHSR